MNIGLNISFVKKIDIEFLRILSDLVRSGKIDPKTAKQRAQEFIDMMPFGTYENLKARVEAFTTKYPEFGHLKIMIMRYEEELQTKDTLEKMRSLMKQNKIDQALTLVESSYN